jgi:3-hydroxybutyryl-CoA dehydrogenase
MVAEADQERLNGGLAHIYRALDRDEERGRLSQERHRRALERIQGTVDLKDLAFADLVIEAVTENIGLKREIFGTLGDACPPDTILASNTSSLSLSEISAASGRQDRSIGLHFFNPPTVLKLVEIVTTADTSQRTIEQSMAFCDSIDRITVRVQDTPGFIVNRLLVPFIYDAIRMVEAGVASPEDVDQACKVGLNHAMGPLATADLVGLDTLAQIGDSMFEEFGDRRFKPPTLLRRMVSLGRLGRKSGHGILIEPADKEAVSS